MRRVVQKGPLLCPAERPFFVLPSDSEASLFGHEMEVPRLEPRNDKKGLGMT